MGRSGWLTTISEIDRGLKWAIELGHFDILMETSMMTTHLALHLHGHLEQLYHMFGYLKSHSQCKLFFDLQHPPVDKLSGHSSSMTGMILLGCPEAVSTHCFVDSDHTGNKVVTDRFLIFFSKALITWHSKRQNTVETCTFGSESIAMKMAVKQIEAL